MKLIKDDSESIVGGYSFEYRPLLRLWDELKKSYFMACKVTITSSMFKLLLIQ